MFFVSRIYLLDTLRFHNLTTQKTESHNDANFVIIGGCADCLWSSCQIACMWHDACWDHLTHGFHWSGNFPAFLAHAQPSILQSCKRPTKTTDGATSDDKIGIITLFLINGLSCVLCKHVIIFQNQAWNGTVLACLQGIKSAIFYFSIYEKNFSPLFILTHYKW